MKLPYLTIFIIFSFLISGCVPETGNIQYNENISVNDSATENIDQIIDQRTETAFIAYEIAKISASEWDPKAELYEIPSTILITNNIGLPAPASYWFFMFSTPDNPREFYIAISEEQVIGSIEAQQMFIEALPYTKQSLEIDQLIDSDVAIKSCVSNNLMIVDNILENEIALDFRLIDLSGGPVWSIFFEDSDPFLPICNVNALDGTITEDPYTPYIDDN